LRWDNREQHSEAFVRITILAGFLAALAAHAQSQPAQPPLTFEVASVKVATSSINGVRGGCRGIDTVIRLNQQETPPPLGRCVITDARLSHLIGIAYGVSMQVLKTSPDWIQRGDLRFDVQAKAEDPTKATEKQLLTMLQNLLVERFQLTFHSEDKEEQGFALTVAKNGPKLHASTSEDSGVSFSRTGAKEEAIGKPRLGEPTTMKARKWSVGRLVEFLSAMGSAGPGVDKTGLTGEYDFTLYWDDEGGPVLSTALRDQLGLVLKPEKIHVSIFVVDSAQKPEAQ
jgi:uncharacterized protein (TIGR03435 family)